jgi:predicted signal transduction protein with EAL and GGDEF domain
METEYAGTKISIQFSAGWVGYERGESTEQFLERADRTLYAEKRLSKKREKESGARRSIEPQQEEAHAVGSIRRER